MLLLALLVVPQEISGAFKATKPVVSGSLGKQLHAHMQACEAFGFSGSILVERKGKVLLRQGYGLAQTKPEIRNTPDTLYDIASLSKQVTATAILKLESEGRLSVEDSISEYLPNVPERHHEVTIYHLLTHTSGFGRYGKAGSGPDLESSMATYLSASRSEKAGERFEYYNGGYAMLAAIVERVTEQTFEVWVLENLFAPAGMKRSGFTEIAQVDPSLLASAEGGHGKLTTDYIKGWGYKGMGGVLTSVSELSLWMKALDKGKLLKKKPLAKLLKPYKDDYACGWYVLRDEGGREVVQHSGSSPGFYSYLRHFVDQDVLVVVLANCEDMCWQVTWGLSALLFGETSKAPALPALELWKDKRFELLSGEWQTEDGVLEIQRMGAGVVVRPTGTVALDALVPVSSKENSGHFRQGRGVNRVVPQGWPSKAALKEAEERALAIIRGLREGSSEPMAADLLQGIPVSWPARVLDSIWPAHVERFGEVQAESSLGAFYEPSTERTRVWVELEHAAGPSFVEVAFVGTSLNIFRLDVQGYPFELRLGPISDAQLVSFDFKGTPPVKLELKKQGKQHLLALTTARNQLLMFERVE